MSRVIISPAGASLEAENGTNMLSLLREAGYVLDAPCGGNGKCGLCRVTVDGVSVKACQTVIDGDCTVLLPETDKTQILGAELKDAGHRGSVIAVDIGTTTVVCSLIRDGVTVKTLSALNPQRSFGADVVSRLRNACPEQTRLIREAIGGMISELCGDITPELISVAANPAMQQIFLGLPVDNLIKLPFKPRLTSAEYLPADEIFPELKNTRLLIIPQPAAYVGADTLACVMATRLYAAEKPTLLIDIGTNAELVLGCRDKLICTSTAAGPALEGAEISCGMRAAEGAIDRVWVEDGELKAHIIGGIEAKGICGSGLIAAVAALLDTHRLSKRGGILPKTEERVKISDGVYLTQEDIRRVQSAKAAISGGIIALTEEYGIGLCDIDRVFIAGAFGSSIDVRSACRMGLLPRKLISKADAIGNAAQYGAALLATDSELFKKSERVAEKMLSLELGSSARFKRLFAENMYFEV